MFLWYFAKRWYTLKYVNLTIVIYIVYRLYENMSILEIEIREMSLDENIVVKLKHVPNSDIFFN